MSKLTDEQKKELNDEIEKAEKTLKLMEQNAEKIKIEDQDGSYFRILKANESYEKHIEHMKSMLK